MTPRKNQPRRKQPTRIEQAAKRARQRRREWKKHPVLKTAALGERSVRYLGRGVRGTGRVAGRMGAATGRFAYAYGSAYSHGRGQNLSRWARNRRAWIARHVEVDTSHMARGLRPGMSPRRRALYVAARSRRQLNQARAVTARRMVRAAGAWAASETRHRRAVARRLFAAADRVRPQHRRNHQRRAAKPAGETPQPPKPPPQQRPQPAGRSSTLAGQPPQPDATGALPPPTLAGQPPTHPKHPPKPETATPTEVRAMSAPNGTGGHPAQVIGQGGVNLGGLIPATDTHLIWTLERLSAATQMVGNGALAFAETLDQVGVDPRVVEPLKGYAQHVAEAAGFPLTAHRQFWALYGHRIEPAKDTGRNVKLDGFFADQRTR